MLKLSCYVRDTRSVLLIIIKAMPIADKTKAPAVKLAIKFANEVVISNSVLV